MYAYLKLVVDELKIYILLASYTYLYFQIQELRGNIRVFCRCRYDDSDECVLRFHENEEEVTCLSSQGREIKFEFEKVYSPDTTQEKV